MRHEHEEEAILHPYILFYREKDMPAEPPPLIALFHAEDREHALEQRGEFSFPQS